MIIICFPCMFSNIPIEVKFKQKIVKIYGKYTDMKSIKGYFYSCKH
jgi:hypothetical protein